MKSDLQLNPLNSFYQQVPGIKKRYFDGSPKAQIWALSDGKFFTVKISSMCGVLCSTYQEAKGYRDMLVQRYNRIEHQMR